VAPISFRLLFLNRIRKALLNALQKQLSFYSISSGFANFALFCCVLIENLAARSSLIVLIVIKLQDYQVDGLFHVHSNPFVEITRRRVSLEVVAIWLHHQAFPFQTLKVCTSAHCLLCMSLNIIFGLILNY